MNTKLTAPIIKEAIEALQKMETIENKNDRLTQMHIAKGLVSVAEEITYIENNTK